MLRCPRPRPRRLAPLRSSSLRSSAKRAPRQRNRKTCNLSFLFDFSPYAKGCYLQNRRKREGDIQSWFSAGKTLHGWQENCGFLRRRQYPTDR